jgi:hypothetical protein
MLVDLSREDADPGMIYDVTGLFFKPENKELVASVISTLRKLIWSDLSLVRKGDIDSMPYGLSELRDRKGSITFPMSAESNKMLWDLMFFEVVSEITIQNTVNTDIKSVTCTFDQDDIEPYDITEVVGEMGISPYGESHKERRGDKYKIHLKRVNPLIERHHIDEKEVCWESYKTSHSTEYWNKDSRPTRHRVCYDTEGNRVAVAIASILQDCTGVSSEFKHLYRNFGSIDQWVVPEELESILIPRLESKGEYHKLY